VVADDGAVAVGTRDVFSEQELARLRGFPEITRAELIKYSPWPALTRGSCANSRVSAAFADQYRSNPDGGRIVLFTSGQHQGPLRASPPTAPPLHQMRQIPLPGDSSRFDYASLDASRGLAFVACDANATLLTVDLNTWQVTGSNMVGAGPDVLAYDPAAQHLYVAA
jgi:DNA-binding beta-propeller fold protein YncE